MRRFLVGLVVLSGSGAALGQPAPAEPTYSITLTVKQIQTIGALLDAATCTTSAVVAGSCDALSTYQAMNAQIVEQNKARAAAAPKDAPK